jgi:uncharacterized protein (TIGR02677 family)
VSVANDFRTLAGWFATASGEDEAQALFSAAFGVWPARHAHLLPVDGEERAPSTKWAEAGPVDVAPALRSSGSLSFRGRAARVDDPSPDRAWRQRRQAEALAAHDDLRASLTTRGRVPLSSFSRLPVDAFDELLDLLATGLDAPQTEDGSRRALSIDGSVEIILWPPTDGTLVAIETDDGRFGSPDFGVSITLTDGPELLATELDRLPVEAAGA